jgi:hypothetical protein
VLGPQAFETVGNNNCSGIPSVVKLVAKGFLIKHPTFLNRKKQVEPFKRHGVDKMYISRRLT